MLKLVGPASVSFFTFLTVFSYAIRVKVSPLPVPIYLILTIIFITSGSMLVSYLSARAYLKERRPSILFVGSGALIFGLTSLVAGLSALPAGLRGSNPATTIFIVGACLSSASHLIGVGLRPLGARQRGGPRSVVTATIAANIMVSLFVVGAALEGLFPTFLIPGYGLTPIATGLLAIAITALGLASLFLVVSSSMSGVVYWYAYALAMTAVGYLGLLLSDWFFEAFDFAVGRTALCLAGAFLVMSVRAAEKRAIVGPDSVLEELFKPLTIEPEVRAEPQSARNASEQSLYERLMLLEADPSSNYERAVSRFAREMVSNGRSVFAFTSKGSPVDLLLHEIPEVRFFILSNVSYPKASDQAREAIVPGNDPAVLLSVIDEAVTKAPGSRTAMVFDNISSLILEIGFHEAYKFLKHVNEIVGSSDVVALFIIMSKAHEDAQVSLIKNLYSAHFAYDGAGLKATKPR